MRFGTYTNRWAQDRYVEVRQEEFTYNPERGEVARDREVDANRNQKVDSVDTAADQVAADAADEWFGQRQDGFPDTFWFGSENGFATDEVLPEREGGADFLSRSVSNGAPQHRARNQLTQDDVSFSFRTATDYDPEAYLLPDPSGPDADRLIRAGASGGFNAYQGTNSFARKPMETFVREDRDMHTPPQDRHDVRPLFYNHSTMATNIPATPTDGNWGFVYDSFDSFGPPYLAEAPYDSSVPISPSLTAPDLDSESEGWAW